VIRTKRWIPWLFVGPALILILFFLAYPMLMTVVRSFYGKGTQIFASTLDYVGLANWEFVFTSPTMLAALRNNALWAVSFTFCTVTSGLLLAVLMDRVRYEKVLKTIIFIPAAISMVGA
jgi:alpha-glucoside transport system permease protein